MAAAPICSPYLVIGVRGSGEDKVGPFGFGHRAGAYAQAASNALPAVDTRYHTLDYAAAPVTNPLTWWGSATRGAELLVSLVYEMVSSCPGIRIGLMGYSQGAYVINLALRLMSADARNSVRAVLLLADPISWGRSNYSKWLEEGGSPGSAYRQGHGMLGREIIPSDIEWRTTDFCIVEDKVCNSRSSNTLWNALSALMNQRVHKEGYTVCCGHRNYRAYLGGEFATRLLGQLGYGRPAPPEIPAPPTGPPPVTSVNGLADGTVLVTSDTGRVYRMVGGAPIWISSCANNLCPNPRPTTQAVINAGPAVPRDAATASDEAGNVFKFVGGAPIHLSSCSVGCGSPVPITASSIVNYDHMRPKPADGATAKDEAGNVFKFVGGAPIHLSSCSVGCGTPVPITAWSVATYEHMRPVPADGATAKDEAGNVFKFVGGAPIHLSSCSVGCGNPVPVTGWSIATLEHMSAVPDDGSTIRDEAGNIFKFAGGAPILLASCAVGCGNPVPITGWSVATLEHMKPVPDDGTTIVSETGDTYVFAGGAPLRVPDCQVSCDTMVRISGASVANLDHMRAVPADHATVRTETGAVYKFAGGAPLWLSDCASGCGDPAEVTQWTIDTREHMHRLPVDATNLRAVETGTLYRTRGGEADLAGQCPAETGCANAVAVNQKSVDSIAHGVANRGPAYGVLSRYFNGVDHFTTVGGVPAGYRLEYAFGLLARTAEPGTVPLYACRLGTDTFSSTSSTCEGQTVVGYLGHIYAAAPADQAAIALYRCIAPGGGHFDSLSSTCEGKTVEFRLGFVPALAPLTRYFDGTDHNTTTAGVPAGHQPEWTLGMLSLVSQPGTLPLYSCQNGSDTFLARDAACEGKQVVRHLGYIYTAPPAGWPSIELFRCMTATGEHFDSISATCEGKTVERSLGHLVARTLLTRAMRGSDHRTSAGIYPAGYRHEHTFGYLSAVSEAGTRPLYSCLLNGTDSFTSAAADCEGREVLGRMGWIWQQPPADGPSAALYRCTVSGTAEHFDSVSATCEGHNTEFLLGYVRVRP
ncbi:hypothetical protein GCM10023170_075570 [Phytohabitans houttuyneae]|uniref:Cutinase n=1 Tax=Phytohabitans houttuyneae TaxID=1076126 RepID=A0A6V8KF00_9ACTN|nr:hypothetical protein Phou_079730 [Phytohabitans houttuyneae]